MLLDLPDVDEVTRRGDLVTATGTGDVAAHVTSALGAIGVVPHQLQVDRTSLEDVFLALTAKEQRT